MPAIVLTLLRACIFLAIELAAFFAFYNRPEGRKAVYFSWYALPIDMLAIFSGVMIMFWSLYAMHNPDLFAVSVSEWPFWLAFLLGSWQAGIHFVKIIIRFLKNDERSNKKDAPAHEVRGD